MSFEGIDEWDENFLDEAIRVELEAIASRNLPSNPPEPTIPRPSSPADFIPSSRPHSNAMFPVFEPPPGRIHLYSEPEPEPESESFAPIPSFRPGSRVSAFDGGGSGGGILSFSPPRELSQRYIEKPNSDVDCEIVEPLVSRNDRCNNRGGGGIEKDRDVERLKRELGRVSKHLRHLERECAELKKERTKKDEQLKCAFSEIEAKETEIHNLKRGNLDHSKLDFQNAGAFIDQACHHHVNEDNCTQHTSQALAGTLNIVYSKTKGENGPSTPFSLDPHMFECNDPQVEHVQAAGSAEHHILIGSTSCTGVNIQERFFPKGAAKSKRGRTVGTQTDNYQDCVHTSLENSTEDHFSSKLLSVWNSPNSIMTGKLLISRLLVTCTADFCVLFRCMGITSYTDLDCHADKHLSHMTLHDDSQSILSVDASKVSHLYSILTKMHNGVAQLHDLLKALLDICTLENVCVVHRSLHILHTILQHLLSYDKRSNKRKNVLIGQPLNNNMHEDPSLQDWNQILDIHHKRTSSENENSGLLMADIGSILENLCTDKEGSPSDFKYLSSENLVSIFKSMQLIAMRNTEESVRIEALSVMILIMMESNPNTERDKFGLMTLLEVVPKLLQKEAGSHVQKLALQLLFLLLNCPKMMMLFSNKGQDNEEYVETVGDCNVALQGAVSSILEGVSECLSSAETGNLELKLRKQAIILLAYVASCGKSGFEVLLKSVGPRDVNFLQLIIQVLASEMDVEISGYANGQALCKERTSLLREALILLNRLASHPVYSRATMEALTSSNTIASLTIDVLNRLPHRSRGFCKYDDAKKSQMEAETTDLARLFRARVFAFL